MTDKDKPFSLSDLDHEDLMVRGVPHARHERMVAYCEQRIAELEANIPRLRYEREIAQRLRQQKADPQARQSLEAHAAAIDEALAQAEQDLADTTDAAAFHRAMAAEMRADLGDKAARYEWLLDIIMDQDDEPWEDDWDEDLDEMVLEGNVCPITLEACPLMDLDEGSDGAEPETGGGNNHPPDLEVLH